MDSIRVLPSAGSPRGDARPGHWGETGHQSGGAHASSKRRVRAAAIPSALRTDPRHGRRAGRPGNRPRTTPPGRRGIRPGGSRAALASARVECRQEGLQHEREDGQGQQRNGGHHVSLRPPRHTAIDAIATRGVGRDDSSTEAPILEQLKKLNVAPVPGVRRGCRTAHDFYTLRVDSAPSPREVARPSVKN